MELVLDLRIDFEGGVGGVAIQVGVDVGNRTREESGGTKAEK